MSRPHPTTPLRATLSAAAMAVLMLGTSCSSDNGAENNTDVTAPSQATTVPTAPAASDDCRGFEAVASYPSLGPLPAPGAMPSQTRMREIQDSGKLVVGVSGDTLLFGARNPFTNQIEGFDIEMLRLVSAAIFGEDRLEFRVITYAQRLPSLQDRSVDLVAHTMTINCTRWNQIGFSTVYYDAGQKVLVRSDSKATTIDELDAAGARVCAPKGSTNLDNLAPYPGVEAVGVDDITDCLVLFQQGKVDAITGDDTVLAGFAAQDPYGKVTGDRFTDEPYGIGANADDVDLIAFVNGVLAQARADGTWKALYEKWLGQFGATPEPPAADNSRPTP